MFVCACTCTHWSPEVNIECLQSSSTLVFETVSFAESEANQFWQSRWSASLNNPPVSISSALELQVHATIPGCYVLEIQIQALILAQQALYWVDHPPAPRSLLLMSSWLALALKTSTYRYPLSTLSSVLCPLTSDMPCFHSSALDNDIHLYWCLMMEMSLSPCS